MIVKDSKASRRLRDKYRLRRAMLAPVAEEPEAEAETEPGIDPSVVTELETRTGALAEENIQLRDVALRQKAEFDNFRRRTLKEKDQLRDSSKEEYISKLLPVIDNFDRALEAAAG